MYDYQKTHHNLPSLGKGCATNTVAKLMPDEGLWAQLVYNADSVSRAPNLLWLRPIQLQQDFNVDAADTILVTDITYIRGHED